MVYLTVHRATDGQHGPIHLQVTDEQYEMALEIWNLPINDWHLDTKGKRIEVNQ